MTPQLTQSIKLLAMNNIELSQFIDEELERNPFLERDSRTDGQPQDIVNNPDVRRLYLGDQFTL